MFSFRAVIERYGSKGEKSGWTYVAIPDDIIIKLKLPDKKAFRIKGSIDDVKFEKLSTYPVGEGRFIMAINSTLKKKLRKKEGAQVAISLQVDKAGPLQSKELLLALKEESGAQRAFKALPVSHQNYFHRYVETAKGADTKAGRIVNIIEAMYKGFNYGEMIRALKGRKASLDR